MSALVPLLVRTFGRTGSTLLMQILGTNPAVFFERQYPFEHRYLSYAYQMSKLVMLPANANKNWNNNNIFQGTESFVGQLPYPTTTDLERDTLSRDLFVSIWESFSRNMKSVNGVNDSNNCFYAEKSPHVVSDLATELLGARNIYLLRDPRDELVSIKSFNKKRGFNSFGWLEEDTDKSYAIRMCKRRKRFMQDFVSSSDEYTRLNIRYEDLINDGKTEVARLSEWLGLELNFKAANADKEIRNRHMTSRNYSESVGRWKSELDAEVQELFIDQLGDELDQLGYAA